MTLLAILTAVTRYRKIVSDLGSAPIDIEQGREIIRSVVDRTPVRPRADNAGRQRSGWGSVSVSISG